jgi:hypothetical protein
MSSGTASAVQALPQALPAGERVLWQGAPQWRQVFLRVFHARKLLVYFGLLLALRAAFTIADGGGASEAALSVLWLVPAPLFVLAMVAVLSWLVERTTWYTVTSRRVVMRIGMVLEVTFNFPFKVIDAVSLRQHPGGYGDIALAFMDGEQIAYPHLWPHARPWHFRRTQPMLRCVPDAARVAGLLAQSLAEAGGGVRAVRVDAPRPGNRQDLPVQASSGLAG